MSRFDPQAKLLWHGDRVKEWLRTGRTKPILVEVAPTGYCNAACPWCFFKGKRSMKHIDSDIMMNAIDDMVKLGVKALNWSGGGEPTLHPDFSLFVKYAARRGLKQGLFTNGYRIIPLQDKFEWIRISLTDKGFSKIKKPRVPFGICVNHTVTQSPSEIKKLCVQAQLFGASYFQTRPALMDNYKKQPWLLSPRYLNKLKSKKFDICVTEYKYEEARKPKDYAYCYGYHFCPSIGWNGKVSTCLYLTLSPKHILGDLNKTRLLNIWPKIIKRMKVSKDCQNCCKNHQINKILYATKHIGAIDFI
jgi:MoaA/NifB/PqqE/SkfB family radical SAM enzyme